MSAFYYIFFISWAKKRSGSAYAHKYTHIHTAENLHCVLYIISYLVTPTFAANDCLPFIQLSVFSLSLPSSHVYHL